MDYIGIDLHKTSSQVCALTEDGELVERRIKTDRESFDKMFAGVPPARILVEASTESEWCARHLESLGHEVIVADPNFAPMYATRDRRIKTDKRDARALCEACRLGAYRPAHRTSDRQRDVRAHLTVREALIRTRSKYIVLIGTLARREGCRIKAGPSPSFARRVEAAALGEDEGQLSRHLMELEEVGLIQVSRGNVSQEDIRVFFPRHEWMVGLEQPPQGIATQPAASEVAATPRLFPEGAASAQTSLLPARPAAAADARANGRGGRGRRRRSRQPQSKHSFEVCLQFVTYQKEVLHHVHIWNATGLARHLHLSGEQDDEIDAWLSEQASDAA